MRKWFLSAALAGSLLVGGCTTTQITNFLGQVQAATAAACLFVPTIDTILAVASALGIPAAGIFGPAITTVANAICSQVPPPTSARFRALPRQGGPAGTAGTINGVVIHGWRV